VPEVFEKERGRVKVFCAVEADKYERIRYIADSMKELARMLGTKPTNLAAYKCRGETVWGLKIIKVVIDDECES
jgi:hypothetical protein